MNPTLVEYHAKQLTMLARSVTQLGALHGTPVITKPFAVKLSSVDVHCADEATATALKATLDSAIAAAIAPIIAAHTAGLNAALSTAAPASA